ncbi:MAG: hypothetical protein GX444_16780 [Myxococcales bacterium]|nr:hypothetical protein [Myxococcales bacterium]
MPIRSISASGLYPGLTNAVKGSPPTEKTAANGNASSTAKNGAAQTTNDQLTPEQKKEVAELKTRDRQVRAHEMAHKAAGAGITGGVSYTYQVGPDGKRYAIGGEVAISVSPEKDPEATVRKMERVRAAALAPADPSSQDRAVANEASREILKANREILTEKTEGDGSTTAAGQATEQTQDGNVAATGQATEQTQSGNAAAVTGQLIDLFA